MNHDELLQELSGVSLYAMHRIRAALFHWLDDPARIEKVKACLQIGMKISYFEDSANRLVEAIILELHRTRLLVENVADKKRWRIHYSTVNLEGVDVEVPQSSGKMDRSAWKVGDVVAFKDRQNRDRYGTIVSLNPKTATVVLKDNQKWRVAYSFLIPVWEGAARTEQYLSDKGWPQEEKTLRVIELIKSE
jgi:hypothetical protein